MRKLEKKLKLWVDNNLITPQQQEKILSFEQSDKKSYLLFALFGLGVWAIALGIISFIAANWNKIGPVCKLTTNFILLISLVAGIAVAREKKKTVLYEIGIFALFLMTPACIGLISQVFHTRGELFDALRIWALFTMPLLAVSHKKLLPLFWVPVFVTGVVTYPDFWRFLDQLLYFFKLNELTVFIIGILFFAGLAYCFSKIDLYFKKRFPVFAVLRGYAEAIIYIIAFLMLAEFDFSVAEVLIALITFSTAALFYYETDNIKMVNLNIVFIGITFIIVFIRLFNTLLLTGLGLIATGVFVLALTWIMKKTMQTITVKHGECQ